MKILITGCARSGTTLLLYLMRYFKNTQVITRDEIMPTKINKINSQHYIEIEPGKILIIKKPLVQKKNKKHESIKKILKHDFKIIYIIRDGRDVIVSHHPMKKHKYHVPPERWIETSTEILPYMNDSRFLFIKYENFVLDTETHMNKISKFLNTEYSEEYREFYKDKDISNGVNQIGHMATGLGDKGARPISKDSTGNWRLEKHKDRMSSLVNGPKENFEQFCDLLIKFDYEKDNSWADCFKE